MKTLIFGKRSYLSKELKKKIKNSSIYSLENFSYNKLKNQKYNLIINSFYSSMMLKKIKNYQTFYQKSLYEL